MKKTKCILSLILCFCLLILNSIYIVAKESTQEDSTLALEVQITESENSNLSDVGEENTFPSQLSENDAELDTTEAEAETGMTEAVARIADTVEESDASEPKQTSINDLAWPEEPVEVETLESILEADIPEISEKVEPIESSAIVEAEAETKDMPADEAVLSAEVLPKIPIKQGFVTENGQLKFYDSEGKLHKGWFTEDGQKYYSDLKNGVVCLDQVKFIDKTPYYFDKTGAMAKDWFDNNGKTGYADPKTGALSYGEVKRIGTEFYTFNYAGSLHSGWVLDRNSQKFAYGEKDGKALYGQVRTLVDANDTSYQPMAFDYRGLLYNGWVYDRVTNSFAYAKDNGKALYGEIAVLNKTPDGQAEITAYAFDYGAHLYHGGWVLDRHTQKYGYSDADGAAYACVKIITTPPTSAFRVTNGGRYVFNYSGLLSNEVTQIKGTDKMVVGDKNGLLVLSGVYWIYGKPYVVERDGYLSKQSKLIALTFDDGPSRRYTPMIMNALKPYGGHATFFVLGQLVNQGADILAEMVAEGHEIGNHSYNHADLSYLGYGGVQYQVDATDQAIINATGQSTALLRPTYGSYNSTVRNAAGKPLILWNVDTRDWQYRDSYSVYWQIMNGASDGAIIIMHDIYSSTAAAVASAVPVLANQGYQFVTVSEMLAAKGIDASPGKVIMSGKTR